MIDVIILAVVEQFQLVTFLFLTVGELFEAVLQVRRKVAFVRYVEIVSGHRMIMRWHEDFWKVNRLRNCWAVPSGAALLFGF